MRKFKVAMISAPEERIPAYCIEKIREFADITCKHCGNPEALAAFAKGSDIIWMFGANVALKPEALDQLPTVKALFRSGSGMDALPLDYAKEHGLSTWNTPFPCCFHWHAISSSSIIRSIKENGTVPAIRHTGT